MGLLTAPVIVVRFYPFTFNYPKVMAGLIALPVCEFKMCSVSFSS